MCPEVVSLGEPMVEFCATSVGRLGEVPLFKRGWGGDTSNFAVAAARQGLSVAHIGRLGGDEFGRSFLDLWKEERMDTSRVVVEPDGWTAIYIISLMGLMAGPPYTSSASWREADTTSPTTGLAQLPADTTWMTLT